MWHDLLDTAAVNRETGIIGQDVFLLFFVTVSSNICFLLYFVTVLIYHALKDYFYLSTNIFLQFLID